MSLSDIDDDEWDGGEEKLAQKKEENMKRERENAKKKEKSVEIIHGFVLITQHQGLLSCAFISLSLFSLSWERINGKMTAKPSSRE